MKSKTRTLLFLAALCLMISTFPLAAHAAPANTSFSTATQLTSSIGDEVTVTGISSGQNQWFYVNATAGQWLYAAVYNFHSAENWNLALYSASNSAIAYSWELDQSVEYIGYTVPTTGRYYFKINADYVGSTSSSCTLKVLLSNGTSGTAATNSGYSRTNAQNYLSQYWQTPNSAYPTFSQDCANFVSQALKAGGMTMLGNSSSRDAASSWFLTLPFVQSTTHYSATWTGANPFTTHWGTNSMGSGYQRAYECKYYIGQDLSDHFSSITSSLKVGDIVQFTQMSNTARSHTLMVYSKNDGDVQLAAHTFNTKSRSLFEEADNAPTKIFVLIRVKSGS